MTRPAAPSSDWTSVQRSVHGRRGKSSLPTAEDKPLESFLPFFQPQVLVSPVSWFQTLSLASAASLASSLSSLVISSSSLSSWPVQPLLVPPSHTSTFCFSHTCSLIHPFLAHHPSNPPPPQPRSLPGRAWLYPTLPLQPAFPLFSAPAFCSAFKGRAREECCSSRRFVQALGLFH